MALSAPASDPSSQLAHNPRIPTVHPLPRPTSHVPNSRFPVLIYRSAIPLPPITATNKSSSTSAETLIKQTLHPNRWFYGGTFKTFWACHFHSVTHECYVVIKGGSLLRLGRGALDPPGGGLGGGGSEGEGQRGEGGGAEVEEGGYEGKGEVEGEEGMLTNPSASEAEVHKGDVCVWVGRGDAIVLPAGVSHCSVRATRDYEYCGFYPEGSPRYDNNWCKAGEEETRSKAETARKVPIPEWDPVFGYKGPLYEIWRENDR